ncbi:EMC3/TMCO1 family protein [Candidatus Nanohalococcus occultus]|uniref:OxaA/SpoJ/YidC translocase/secretase, sec-independent itegration of nascent memrane proteins into membrane n=1 Tax=Candidatus Nanohalococcus occultus TaxID=2978047 RepID=A0ABY8CIX1_9ARCH|nr:OxaA/SpoJ/YidC translocase/secretase, sec-independent itegration of nascent memrane proteins into membrane [Candidatus Nanohaloarchaeota archaeon SVXNc]
MISTMVSNLYAAYSTVFQPLLALEHHIGLGIFAVTLAGFYSVIHWYIGDHEKIKRIEERMNEHQSKAQAAEDEQKTARHQKKAMSLQQKMMVVNFKPILVIMLVSILFFPWLRATYSPTVNMNRTSNHTYRGSLNYAGREDQLIVRNVSKPVLELRDQKAEVGESFYAVGSRWQLQKFKTDGRQAKLSLNADFLDLPFSLPLAGSAINWLGYYLLLSIPASNISRRLLGIA